MSLFLLRVSSSASFQPHVWLSWCQRLLLAADLPHLVTEFQRRLGAGVTPTLIADRHLYLLYISCSILNGSHIRSFSILAMPVVFRSFPALKSPSGLEGMSPQSVVKLNRFSTITSVSRRTRGRTESDKEPAVLCHSMLFPELPRMEVSRCAAGVSIEEYVTACALLAALCPFCQASLHMFIRNKQEHTCTSCKTASKTCMNI